MFAVVESGGKQYRIEEGETLDVELLKIAQGEKITFDNVLMVGDGEKQNVTDAKSADDSPNRERNIGRPREHGDTHFKDKQ